MRLCNAVCCSLVLLLAVCASAFGGVVYVRQSSTGPTLDGLTWDTAFRSISAAVEAAANGDEIWVARGTYARFTVSKCIKVYGGFPAAGGTWETRNFAANRTVVYGTESDFYGVVYFNGSRADGARLDGFTVFGGRCGVQCASASPTIANNIIKLNRQAAVSAYSSSATIVNNVITLNGDGGDFGAIALQNPSADTSLVTVIANNTIAYNRGIAVSIRSCSPIIVNNVVAFHSFGIANVSGTPLPVFANNCGFRNGQGSGFPDQGNIEADPKLVDILHGECHLLAGSPCIDAGDNTAPASESVDIDGKPRVYPMGGTVDIGADEYDGTVWSYSRSIVRVSTSGSDLNDGSSWAQAKATIQDGVWTEMPDGGDVLVAAGTYSGFVEMARDVSIYGGFPTSGGEWASRDPAANETTLCSGNTYRPVVMFSRSTFNTSGVYGLTITGGGCGVYCASSSPVISGNKIMGNTECGVFCDMSAARVVNNIISHNGTHKQLPLGGGVYWFDNHPENWYGICTPTLANNTIVCNTATGGGGGVYVSGAPLAMSNNIIAGNSSGIYGVSDPSQPPVLKHNCLHNPAGAEYTGLNPGLTDILADPGLVSLDGGDYHLLPGSPCIDAGTNDGAPSVDFDGKPRPVDGNGDGVAKVDLGCYEFGVSNISTIAHAKSLDKDAPVGIASPVVTAILPDRFYVENTNRVGGIGVIGAAPAIGTSVAIEGSMDAVDGERIIRATKITPGVMKPAPKALLMNQNALGGGPQGLQSGVSDWRLVKKTDAQGKPYYARELFEYCGVSNIGLLVKMTGRVSNSSPDHFYLDSSACSDDGNESIKGVRVDWPFTANPPANGSTVIVVGISSCRVVHDDVLGDIVVRMLRPVGAEAVTPAL